MAAVTLQNRKSEPNLADLLVQSAEGPVLLSSEQRPSHVLMTIADYERIISGKLNIVEKLWMPGMSDIDFDPLRSNESAPAADFS
jgi:PHD/YefM family antitoxin component YafN of YafNO toxin-antitoxin module